MSSAVERLSRSFVRTVRLGPWTHVTGVREGMIAMTQQHSEVPASTEALVADAAARIMTRLSSEQIQLLARVDGERLDALKSAVTEGQSPPGERAPDEEDRGRPNPGGLQPEADAAGSARRVAASGVLEPLRDLLIKAANQAEGPADDLVSDSGVDKRELISRALQNLQAFAEGDVEGSPK